MAKKNIFTTLKKGVVLIGALGIMIAVTACADGNNPFEALTGGQAPPIVEDLTLANTFVADDSPTIPTNEQVEQTSETEIESTENTAPELTEPNPTPEPTSITASQNTVTTTEPTATPAPTTPVQQTQPSTANDTPTTSVTSHPFADALSEFFINIAPVPEWALLTPYHTVTMSVSTHAILVDVDGNGTQGMLASKWTTDVQRYLPHSSAESILVHRLFLQSPNGQTRPIALDNMAVTPAGRLVTTSAADGQGISMSTYTLLDFNNGQLTPVKSIMRTAYGHWEYHGVSTWVASGEADSYAVNHHTSEFWSRSIEQDQPLTHAEFHQLLATHGL